MYLSLRQSRKMDRRRRRLRFVKWIVVVGLLAGLGMAAYETGSVLAQREVARLGDEVASLQRQVEVLRRQNAHLATDAGAARLRERDLRLRYEADMPDGAVKALLDRIRARLADGVSAEHLDFMVSTATGAPACDGQPETERLMVRTPLSRGANDAAGFADRTISVSATGASATSEGGAPELWFDPGKPVVLSFVEAGRQDRHGRWPVAAAQVAAA